MKTVILCGGRGLRLMPHTANYPKPMVYVGPGPLLWHVMRTYASQGHTDFVLLAGYKAETISEWVYGGWNDSVGWRIDVVDTGDDTPTGGRLLRAREHIGDGAFMLTYGDGLSNVNLSHLLQQHAQNNALVTLTAAQPTAPWGLLDIDRNGCVGRYDEKPKLRQWVNAGFMVCGSPLFKHLSDGFDLADVLQKVAAGGALYAAKHFGFFRAVDTCQDLEDVRTMWDRGEAPWAPK